MQVYVYYLAFSNDSPRTRALVYGVYLVEMTQTFLLTYTAFKTFAIGFGNIGAIIDGSILWFSIPIMSSAVAFVVQVFYAYRISVLAKSKAVAILILFFALFQFAGGIATGVIAHQVTLFTDFLVKRTYIATGIWNGGSAVCDVLIAGAMTYYLSLHNSQWKPTQRVVQRLIRLIVETGTLTAAIAIVNLSLSLLPGKPTYFQTSSAVLGKIYSNTMMVVFNSRIRFGQSEGFTTADHLVNAPRPGGLSISRGGTGVVVTREEYRLPLESWDYQKKQDVDTSTGSRAKLNTVV